VRTGYGLPAPKASLTVLPVRESGGVIFVWRSNNGGSPTWEPPELPMVGWQAPMFRTFDIATHPQQIVENSIDVGHFATLHKPPAAAAAPDVSLDGDTWRITSAFRVGGVQLDSRIHLYGLGFMLGEVNAMSARIKLRFYAMPTPTDPWRPGRPGDLTGLVCHGNVLLNDGFRSSGEILMPGACITRDLDFTKSELHGDQLALDARGVQVDGCLMWKLAHPPRGEVDLSFAKVTRLNDDLARWPDGNLTLTGFDYQTLNESPKVDDRISWLGKIKKYSPDP
jgi:hypothetical protein